MIDELKPYPAMKTSGVEWLGNIPGHWEIASIGRIGRLFKGNGGSKEDEVPSGVPCVRYGDLYTRHELFIRDTKACVKQDRAPNYTPIHYGDLLFAASGETIEDIGKSAANLLETEACCGGDILVLRPKIAAAPKFLGYAADAAPSRNQKARMGRGFTVVHIYAAQLKQLTLPLPPLPEQTAIVRFLDHANKRIRRYIAAKQKLIKLLNEQKQSIIHHAVTRGLNPNIRIKPSGVEWLGDIPQHWEVRQLRRLIKRGTTITYGIVQAGPDLDGGIPYIRTSNMRGQSLPETGYLRTSAEIDRAYFRSKVAENDLVVAIRATLGKGLLVPGFLAGANLTQGTARVSPGNQLLPKFLLRAFNAHYCQESIRLVAKGTTFLEITLEALRRIPLAIPPIDEQEAILQSIDAAIARLEPAIERAHHEIVLLREYRSRLIADVVTGKLDVREAAAELPDETDEPMPAEDFEEAGDESELATKTELDQEALTEAA